MNILDILVILFIGFLIFKYYSEIYNKKIDPKNNKDIEGSEKNNKKNKKKDIKETFSVDYTGKLKEAEKIASKEDIYNQSMKYIDQILKHKQKIKVNPYLQEMQFHNDYRDTQNAIILLVPNQKQLFNRSNLPVINVSTPTNNEILPLVKNFINEMNRVLDQNVADEYAVRDWKNAAGEKDYKSGWDKQQEKLGLPGSIFNKPCGKEAVKLIKVEHSERRETEDEIQYVVFMVLQKPSAKDQMLLKATFHIDKQDINLERDFFAKGKNQIETLIRIEEVFVIGFLTKHSFGKQSIRTEYYDYGGITNGRMFSQKQIMEELNRKRKQYEVEAAVY
jgi:hypothetical protein